MHRRCPARSLGGFAIETLVDPSGDGSIVTHVKPADLCSRVFFSDLGGTPLDATYTP
jgi:hypothetical protein